MARPIPLPSLLVVKYRSKIFSRISSGMPVPSSAMRRTAFFLFSSSTTRRRTPVRHGLRPILNHIERRLFQQVGIHVCHQWIGRKRALQRHVTGGQLFSRQGQNVAEHLAQILFSQLQFHRTREVHQSLHDAVEAMNLGVDHLKVTRRGCIVAAEFCFSTTPGAPRWR